VRKYVVRYKDTTTPEILPVAAQR